MKRCALHKFIVLYEEYDCPVCALLSENESLVDDYEYYKCRCEEHEEINEELHDAINAKEVELNEKLNEIEELENKIQKLDEEIEELNKTIDKLEVEV